MKQLKKRSERGSILMVVLFIAAAIGALAALSSSRVVSETRQQKNLENESLALTDAYAQGRENDERFLDWTARVGKRNVREIIKPFMKVPPHAEDPTFYVDWSDAREFTVGDLGVGECAGEVVSLFGIEVVKAESQAFDAQVALEEGDAEEAEDLAWRAMLSAARALVRTEYIDVTESPDDIVKEFQTRFFDTERFFDRYARGKFGQYMLDRHAQPPPAVDRDVAAQRVEEALLFIEAAHACEARISAVAAVGGAEAEARPGA